MEVLILSKTHVGTSACVGGISLKNNEYVRLLNPGKTYQPGNTEFKVGEVWEIDYEKSPDKPPHVEDIIIKKQKFARKINDLSSYLSKATDLEIWKGGPQALFDGKLKWTSSNSGYISEKTGIPKHSVGFWVPDKDLRLIEDKYYEYGSLLNKKRLHYVGFEPMIGTIKTGTIIRVSLAKWWKPVDVDIEKRCYLQLSGWY
jgi:hypothetical protein